MNIWWNNCSTICLSVILRDQRDHQRLKVNAAFSCAFSNLILRPRNWHPIRQRMLTCVRWELFSYFGELQHDVKTVFWLTELRLDGTNVWWCAAVSSALLELSFLTRSCHSFEWYADSDWALFGRRAPQLPRLFPGKSVSYAEVKCFTAQSLTWPINIFIKDYSTFTLKGLINIMLTFWCFSCRTMKWASPAARMLSPGVLRWSSRARTPPPCSSRWPSL